MPESISIVKRIIDVFKTTDDVVVTRAGPQIGKTIVKELESTNVADIMQKRFIIFSPSATIKDILTTFMEKNIDEALIVEGGKLFGIITHRDILKLIEEVNLQHQSAFDDKEFHRKIRSAFGVEVSKIVKKKIYVFPTASLFDAVIKMDENDLTILPVVDENGYMMGIVRERDIIQGVLNFLMQ